MHVYIVNNWNVSKTTYVYEYEYESNVFESKKIVLPQIS